MNTKEKFNRAIWIGILLPMLVWACTNEHAGHDVNAHTTHDPLHEGQTDMTYTCPMHPDVVSDRPGLCPICNMHLEVIAADTLIQTQSPAKLVLSNQATVTAKPSASTDTLDAHGFIDINPNRNQSVAARFGGRIEKLFVKYHLQYLSAGERIMELYSPELRTKQEEHLFLLRSESDQGLLEKSRERLSLLGITQQQIAQLEESRIITPTVTLFSPASGYVFFRSSRSAMNPEPESASDSEGMSMSEGGKQEQSYAVPLSQIREGMYVNEGAVLFEVNDLRSVWVLLSIPNQFLSHIREHQMVQIFQEGDTAHPHSGRISLLEQVFQDDRQRFARVRIELPNTDKLLKINSLVTARIPLITSGDMQVPSSAVFFSGKHAYVWVKSGSTTYGTGIFLLRKVMVKPGNNGSVILISGLEPTDEIAVEAGLMTDSETILNNQ